MNTFTHQDLDVVVLVEDPHCFVSSVRFCLAKVIEELDILLKQHSAEDAGHLFPLNENYFLSVMILLFCHHGVSGPVKGHTYQ